MLDRAMSKSDPKPPPLPPPSRPSRGFPWRLLLWAMLMTAATGALAYQAWIYREDKLRLASETSTCRGERAQLQGQVETLAPERDACRASLADATAAREELDAQLTQLSGKLDASREELAALRAQRAEVEKRIAAIEDIRQQFAQMVDTGQLQVTSRRGNLVLALPAEVLFPPASATLERKGEIALLQVGGILKQFGDRRFLVVGHTDNLPIKSNTFRDNWELSAARALTVTRVLVEAGMKPENLIAAGAGEHDPVADNGNAKERARNRRIDIVLLPALSELPPLPASIGAEKAP